VFVLKYTDGSKSFALIGSRKYGCPVGFSALFPGSGQRVTLCIAGLGYGEQSANVGTFGWIDWLILILIAIVLPIIAIVAAR